jgi:beta-lactamase regulating signal transducer with metallopeptidase domain
MDPFDHKPIQQTSSKIKVVSPAQQIVEQAKCKLIVLHRRAHSQKGDVSRQIALMSNDERQ